MDYQNLKIEDIIDWCKEHNQVEWLKATAAKQVECKVYPRKKVVKMVNGVEKVRSVADKSQPPKIEMRPITFVQLKKEFVTTFLSESMPLKEKKPSMYDLIANL